MQNSDQIRMEGVMICIVLLLGLSIVSTLSAATAASNSASCPLDFKTYNYVAEPGCQGASPTSPEAENCCLAALHIFSQALAAHTNITRGQPLFLDSSTEKACADNAAQNGIINSTNCSAKALTYTANASGCSFATVADLQRTLELATGPNITLNTLEDACKDVTGDCVTCNTNYARAKSALTSYTHDDADLCGAAVLVTVASSNIGNTKWVNDLYTCLGVPTITDSQVIRRTSMTQVLLGTIFGFLLFVFLVLLVIYLRRHYRPKKLYQRDFGSALYGDQIHGLQRNKGSMVVSFSPKELLRATDNFSEENLLGEGSAGTVHRGMLPSGQLVAVKRIDKDKELDTFEREVDSLSRVRHPNLVTLLGYCHTDSEHQLVYEYCSKGNLWQWLFGGRLLTWEQRVNIAVGSAKGLWFLHKYPEGQIVHRDIKPTNILLTENLEAKVSDFGLSKFITMDESRVFTEVKGTAGYLDPEYIQNGQLTFSSDVYSFGVVLLQLISGRRPIDLNPNEHMFLVKAAMQLFKAKRLQELIDPRLEGKYCVPAFEQICKVALRCTNKLGVHRPDMIEVLQGLEKAMVIARSYSSVSPHVSLVKIDQDSPISIRLTGEEDMF